jgi:hypothetical protein
MLMLFATWAKIFSYHIYDQATFTESSGQLDGDPGPVFTSSQVLRLLQYRRDLRCHVTSCTFSPSHTLGHRCMTLTRQPHRLWQLAEGGRPGEQSPVLVIHLGEHTANIQHVNITLIIEDRNFTDASETPNFSMRSKHASKTCQ